MTIPATPLDGLLVASARAAAATHDSLLEPMATSTPSQGDVFSLLSNQRRRYTVRGCQELETPVELGELAEYVAAAEHNKPPAEVTSEERRRVYSSLQQRHLDKLEAAGVIERERKTITPTQAIEDLEFYLEVVPGNEVPWAEFYLGLTAIAGAVVTAGWLGVYPDVVSGYAWAGLVLVAFGLSASIHTYRRRQRSVSVDDWVEADE